MYCCRVDDNGIMLPALSKAYNSNAHIARVEELQNEVKSHKDVRRLALCRQILVMSICAL